MRMVKTQHYVALCVKQAAGSFTLEPIPCLDVDEFEDWADKAKPGDRAIRAIRAHEVTDED